jgi:PAS domain S-box-containing protein
MSHDTESPQRASPSANPEMRFRELFEQAPVSLQILAADGRTVQVNGAWRDLWQIHTGTPVLAYVLGDYNVLTDAQLEAKGVLPYLRRAFAGESVQIPAIRYDTAELGVPGPSRWVTARAHPLKDSAGRVLEVMLMHEDITERVQTENTLREREERFRSLATATSQIIWTTDAAGRIVSVSESWTHFTGQDPQAFLSNAWPDALHPDDRDTATRRWEEAIRTGNMFEVTYRLRRHDGVYRWMSVKGVPVYDAGGTLREWIGANADIDDMVTAQATLAQQLERERRQSALLAKVANASRTLQSAASTNDLAEAIVNEVRDILEVHQAVVSLNAGDAWEQSINAASLSDKYAAYAAYAVSNARPNGSGIYAEVCRTNKPMRLTQAELLAHPAWRGFGADAGRHPPMRGWLAVPLIARDGRNLGLIQASDKIDGDFTAGDEAILVQLASIAAIGFENAQLVAALQEQDRRKDEFLAMLAHELRNPLAPISAAAHVLGRTAGESGRVRQYSDIILRQVGHMSVLMNDLLDVSRVTRGMVRLDSAPVDLFAVIANAVEQVRPLVDAKKHVLAVEGTQPRAVPALVHGDRARLVQIVSNLLTNAAKYTPPGGRIVLAVELSDSGNGALARIRVSDNGSGIEPALLPHLFELFTQGKRTLDRSQGGLGLGLALVKNMTALHGGRVEAHSDGPGRGSTFVVELPLLEQAQTLPPAASDVATTDPTEGGEAARTLHVVVVDDNPDSALTLAGMLRAHGHRATPFTDPLALTAAEAWAPADAFILDIGMPGLDGYELVRRLRGHPDTAGALCIALSGYGQPGDHRQSLVAGFDHHFVKPVDTDRLFALLESHCRSAAASANCAATCAAS